MAAGRRTGVPAFLSVGDFAVELAGRDLQARVDLVDRHAQVLLDVRQVLDIRTHTDGE